MENYVLGHFGKIRFQRLYLWKKYKNFHDIPIENLKTFNTSFVKFEILF